MIYLDSSVALAQLLAENRRLPEALRYASLTSSRLLEYEIWNRIHAGRLAPTHTEDVQEFIGRVSLIELTPPILARAIEPFPISVRTLDALHLATIEYMRSQRQSPELATFDVRMLACARSLGIALYEL